MSSPMEDIPEHVMVPVDADGNGPVDVDHIDHWVCWCNDDNCTNVQHIVSDEGTRMCADFADVDIEPMVYEDPSMARGRCTLCAGYAARLQQMISEGDES